MDEVDFNETIDETVGMSLFKTPSKSNNNGNNGRASAKYTVSQSADASSIAQSHNMPSNTTTASANQQPAPLKLGIVISRIPVGLYVHCIPPNSEAYTVSISPGSILIDGNGMGLLG